MFGFLKAIAPAIAMFNPAIGAGVALLGNLGERAQQPGGLSFGDALAAGADFYASTSRPALSATDQGLSDDNVKAFGAEELPSLGKSKGFEPPSGYAEPFRPENPRGYQVA